MAFEHVVERVSGKLESAVVDDHNSGGSGLGDGGDGFFPSKDLAALDAVVADLPARVFRDGVHDEFIVPGGAVGKHDDLLFVGEDVHGAGIAVVVLRAFPDPGGAHFHAERMEAGAGKTLLEIHICRDAGFELHGLGGNGLAVQEQPDFRRAIVVVGADLGADKGGFVAVGVAVGDGLYDAEIGVAGSEGVGQRVKRAAELFDLLQGGVAQPAVGEQQDTPDLGEIVFFGQFVQRRGEQGVAFVAVHALGEIILADLVALLGKFFNGQPARFL